MYRFTGAGRGDAKKPLKIIKIFLLLLWVNLIFYIDMIWVIHIHCNMKFVSLEYICWSQNNCKKLGLSEFLEFQLNR